MVAGVGINYEYLTDEPGKKYNTKCIKDNGFCYGEGTEYLTKKSAKIDGCFVHSVKTLFTIDGIANYKKDDVFNFIKNMIVKMMHLLSQNQRTWIRNTTLVFQIFFFNSVKDNFIIF